MGVTFYMLVDSKQTNCDIQFLENRVLLNLVSFQPTSTKILQQNVSQSLQCGRFSTPQARIAHTLGRSVASRRHC